MHSFGLLPPWRNTGEYRPIAEDVEHQAPRNTGSTSNSTINLDGAIDPVKAGRLGLFFSLFVLSCFAVLALITHPTIPQEANSNYNDIAPLGKGRHLFSRCHTHCKDECGHWKDEKGDVLCCDWSHRYRDAQMCPIYISPDDVCYCTNELQLFDEDSSFPRYKETNVDGEGDEDGQLTFAGRDGSGGMIAIQGNNPDLLHHRHKGKKDRNNDDDRNSISSEVDDDGDDDDDRRHHKRDKHEKDHHHDKKDKNHPDKPYPPPSPLPFPKDGKPSGSRIKFGIEIDPKDLPKRGDLPSKKEIKEKVDPVLDEIRDAIDKVHERIDGEIRDIK